MAEKGTRLREIFGSGHNESNSFSLVLISQISKIYFGKVLGFSNKKSFSSEYILLIINQRQQWVNYQSHPVLCVSSQLESQTLPSSCREKPDHIFIAFCRIYNFPLERPELRISKESLVEVSYFLIPRKLARPMSQIPLIQRNFFLFLVWRGSCRNRSYRFRVGLTRSNSLFIWVTLYRVLIISTSHVFAQQILTLRVSDFNRVSLASCHY